MKLRLSRRLIKLVAIIVLSSFPLPLNRNHFVAMITNRYTKLTEEIPLGATITTHSADTFSKLWVITYYTPSHIVTINDPSSKIDCLRLYKT